MGFAATSAITEFWAKCKSTFATVDKIYPIGSIYMSANSADPSVLFGGTWVQLEDAFLLGAGSTYSVNHVNDVNWGGVPVPSLDGGSASHSHTTSTHQLTEAETPVHAHTHNMTQPAFTVGKHDHRILNSAVMYNNASSVTTRMATSGNGTKISLNTNLGYSTLESDAFAATRSTNAAVNARVYPSGESETSVTAHGHGDTGDSSSLPPYMVVYIWKRTA